MSDIAVEVNHVSKKFHRGEFHDSLRDFIPAMAKRFLGRGSCRNDLGKDDFWALNDVSFQVQRGEVLGIIGPNGAGKSTLLKVLSKIIKPTRGSIRVEGRLRALIEVAAGFHGDLTGRENIYLNGSILGMKRAEIDRKFDEIVDFAGIAPFLDTPVKRYSSGMYARLGFAVAAHLDPEVLIVDEVLAVGDFTFQKKCLGKMQNVAGEGRTVLFVSHNMAAVESLCGTAALLDHGRLVAAGRVGEVIREYYQRVLQPEQRAGSVSPNGNGKRGIVQRAVLCDERGNPTCYLPLGGDFHLRIDLDVPAAIEDPAVGVGIDSTLGGRLLTVHSPLSARAIPRVAGRCSIECRIPAFPLGPGDYFVKVALGSGGGEMDSREQALWFTVVDAEAFGEGRGFHRGVCVAASQWSVSFHDEAAMTASTSP